MTTEGELMNISSELEKKMNRFRETGLYVPFIEITEPVKFKYSIGDTVSLFSVIGILHGKVISRYNLIFNGIISNHYKLAIEFENGEQIYSLIRSEEELCH